jgi:anti-anti-sigma regulatory factor
VHAKYTTGCPPVVEAAKNEAPKMMFNPRQSETPATLPVTKLPAILDMRNTQDLRDRLLSALEASPVLQLDGSETTQVATPGVQLLLAASQSAKAKGGKIIMTDPSPALEAAFLDLGVAAELTEWREAHA